MEDIWYTIYFYQCRSLNLLGIVLNFICIVVFIKIVKRETVSNNSNLFKYLLMKAFCDFIYFLMIIPEIIYNHKDQTYDTSYLLQIWFKWIDEYLINIFELLSVFFEIAATFDCYLLISQRLKCFINKLTFYLFSIITIIFCTLYYIPFIIGVDIKSKNITINDSNANEIIYYYEYNDFESSDFSYYHLFIHSLLRDILPIFILIILNVLILLFLYKTKKNKRNFANKNSSSIISARRAENNKIKMIIFISLLYLLHFPMILKNFGFLNNIYLCLIFFQISYAISIVSYILFNKTFRKYTFQLFNIY